MIVISDTSPLRYLVITGLVELLPAIYGTVYCPPEVIEECSAIRAPAALRAWVAAPPAWVVIRGHTGLNAVLLEQVDPGEAAAISLAHDMGASLLIMDDRLGRRVANSLGFEVTGTLGVISVATKKGLVDFDEAIRLLHTMTNFRLSPAIIEAARPAKD